MQLITIQEKSKISDGFTATLCFNNNSHFDITIKNPFTSEQEDRLEWYFEKYLEFPFVKSTDFEKASCSIKKYGEELFNQVFSNAEAYDRYRHYLRYDDVKIEIMGSPEFHSLHWEAMSDPKIEKPLCTQFTIIRKGDNSQTLPSLRIESSAINLLIVTSRPFGERDVGYRTISRPLVEGLREANLPVHIDILRPATYEELVNKLSEAKVKYGTKGYHIIHFDVHGKLYSYNELRMGISAGRILSTSRYGRKNFVKYEGKRAYILLDGKKANPIDLIEAGELSELINQHKVPIIIFNACQSGKQVGSSETSLANRIINEGVPIAFAMSYSITINTAEIVMTNLYKEIYKGNTISQSINYARTALYTYKARQAYYNQIISLEDWMLPVLYQNREVELSINSKHEDMKVEQSKDYSFPAPQYGFVGRDSDILKIERKLLLNNRNILLLMGMGGSGKTTLLHHISEWWYKTHFVEGVFYFGYDERAWTVELILERIAKEIFTNQDSYTQFRTSMFENQEEMVAKHLTANRYLLVLDNLESITGTSLAILNTLSSTEQMKLKSFLSFLSGGKTLIILGSRGGEAWIGVETFKDNTHELLGLDQEASSLLANRVLEKIGKAEYQKQKDFQRLMNLLNGFPLAIEVVLSNLISQRPTDILKAFQSGDIDLNNTKESNERTRQILKCIDYSHSNLSSDGQKLLLCLAPFSSVIAEITLDQYSEFLEKNSLLSKLPFQKWNEVLEEAKNWGLLSKHPDLPGYLLLQPTFPYFLSNKLNDQRYEGIKYAIETAFREYYDWMGDLFIKLHDSDELKHNKQSWQMYIEAEYENLLKVLTISIKEKKMFISIQHVLSEYLDMTQDHERGLEMGEIILNETKSFTSKQLEGEFGLQLYSVINDEIASRLLYLKRYKEAEEAFNRALSILSKSKFFDSNKIRYLSSATYSQLGYLTQEQGRWIESEENFKKALGIMIEFEDILDTRADQANTYHNLGTVFHGQNKLDEAKECYLKALKIKNDLGDPYLLAGTYDQLGRIAGEQRDWKDAKAYFLKAARIYNDYNDTNNLSTCNINLSHVSREFGDPDGSEELLQSALENKINTNDQSSQSVIYHNLGKQAEEQGDLDSARDYFIKALGIAYRLGDEEGSASILYSLSKHWSKTKDQKILKAVSSIMKKTQSEAMEFLEDPMKDKKTLASEMASILNITPEQAGIILREDNYYDPPLTTKIASAIGFPPDSVIEMLKQISNLDQ